MRSITRILESEGWEVDVAGTTKPGDAEVIASTADQVQTAGEEAKKASEIQPDDPGLFPTWLKVTLGLALLAGGAWLGKPYVEAGTKLLEARAESRKTS